MKQMIPSVIGKRMYKKVIQAEQQKIELKKNEKSLRNILDNMKYNNICIMGIPEGGESEKGIENLGDFFLFLILFFNFLKIILLLFIYSCLHFPPPLPPTPAKPTSLSCFHPPPWFCLCVLYSCS